MAGEQDQPATADAYETFLTDLLDAYDQALRGIDQALGGEPSDRQQALLGDRADIVRRRTQVKTALLAYAATAAGAKAPSDSQSAKLAGIVNQLDQANRDRSHAQAFVVLAAELAKIWT